MQALLTMIQSIIQKCQRSGFQLKQIPPLAFTSLLIVASSFSNPVTAQQDNWWFDVEVILFKRNIDGTELNENFPYAIKPISLENATDLISDRLYPDTSQLSNTLSQCYTTPNQDIQLPKQTSPGFEIDESLFQNLPPDPDPAYSYSQLNEAAFTYRDEKRDEYAESETVQLGDSQNERQNETGQNERGQTEIRGAATQHQAQNQSIPGAPPSLESFEMAFTMPEESLPKDPPQEDSLAEDTQLDNIQTNTEELAVINAFDGPPLPEATEYEAEKGSREESREESPEETLEGTQELDALAQIKALAIHDPLPLHNRTYEEKQAFDLLNVEVPDSLACTFASEQEDAIDGFIQQFFSPHQLSLKPEINYPENIPVDLAGLQRDDVKGPYILPRSELQLQKLARDLNRKRGINNMLHFAWRQHVAFGRNSAKSYRLYAGKNYSSEYDYVGYPLLPKEQEFATTELTNEDSAPLGNNLPDNSLPEYAIQIGRQNPSDNEDLVSKIKQALDKIDQIELTGSPTTNNELPILQVPEVAENLIPEQVWELDGLFKLYLQNIGSVPYLHIDSQFNYRQPTILEDFQLPEEYSLPVSELMGTQTTDANAPAYFLKPYPFQQLRRVISRQIHYFDHPMFGMVVQIRRYQIPDYMR